MIFCNEPFASTRNPRPSILRTNTPPSESPASEAAAAAAGSGNQPHLLGILAFLNLHLLGILAFLNLHLLGILASLNDAPGWRP